MPNLHDARVELGRVLRELREAAGLRQQDVADRLGAPQSFVSKYESGERRLEIFELQAICAACDSDLGALTELLRERIPQLEIESGS